MTYDTYEDRYSLHADLLADRRQDDDRDEDERWLDAMQPEEEY